MKPSRALIIVWEYPPGPGGIGQHAFSVTQALVNRGIKVKVITSGDYATRESIQNFDRDFVGVDIIRIMDRNALRRGFLRIWNCYKMTRKFKPDRIICSGKGALWLMPLLTVWSDTECKVLAFIHGSELRLKNVFAQGFTQWSLRFADRLFPVSTFTKALLSERLRTIKEIQVVHNGLLPDELPKMDGTLPKFLKGNPALLTVGQLSKRKGQHRVVAALPELVKQFPGIHYHMVGLPTERKYIEELANQLSVSSNISIHGAVAERNDLFRYYQSCDAFIMLSENQPNGDVEGFGIAILEANYFGKPAIGAEGCGIEDAIRNDVNGYVVDGNSPEAITEAVRKSLELAASGEQHIKRYSESFNWNNLITPVLS